MLLFQCNPEDEIFPKLVENVIVKINPKPGKNAPQMKSYRPMIFLCTKTTFVYDNADLKLDSFQLK